MTLKKILSKIEKELKDKEDTKDEVYGAMRKATRLSKQAIFSAHKRQMKEAKQLLMEAERLFAKLNYVAAVHQELVYAGIVDAAFQEYAEAYIFLKYVLQEKFVGPEKLHVPSTSYLLGLADVIGELRRKTLDALKEADIETAEKSLETMEHIYNELIVMDEALRSVSELRRKCDVARKIIESTRGDVAIEGRRNSLEKSLNKLEKLLRTKRKK